MAPGESVDVPFTVVVSDTSGHEDNIRVKWVITEASCNCDHLLWRYVKLDFDLCPTAVEGIPEETYTAVRQDNGDVQLSWETVLEIDLVGMQVMRATAGGPYEQIAVIPAGSPGGVWGGSYAYLDEGVPQTEVAYKICIQYVDSYKNGCTDPRILESRNPSGVTISSLEASGGGFRWLPVLGITAGLVAGVGGPLALRRRKTQRKPKDVNEN